MDTAVGAWPRSWGRGQACEGVNKAVGQPWGRDQGLRGLAKAAGAWPRPRGVDKAVEALLRP